MARKDERSAFASIRGYLYQTVLAAQAWLGLHDDEVLVVEGDEDFDRLLRGEQTSVQVRARDRVIGLRSASKALAAFARAYAARGAVLRFVYVSTETLRSSRRASDLLRLWAEDRDHGQVAAALAELAEEQVWQVPWADGRADWLGFVRAVRFELEQPQLAEVRADLERQLGHDPRTTSLAEVGALAQRLLDDLLTASSQGERGLRRRTRADLEKLIASTRDDLAAWARGTQAQRLVGWLQAIENLTVAVGDGTRMLQEAERPTQLLDASYEVIPFFDNLRSATIDEFAVWCQADTKVAARVVVGAGGTGKTRLFIELCRRFRAAGWHAGFLKGDITVAKAEVVGVGFGDRLVVVDYAETRFDVTRAVLLAIVQASARCRVVLLAREPGPWLDALKAGGHDEGELLTAQPIRLPPLTTTAEARREIFPAMVEAFATARGKAAPEPLPAVDLADSSLDLALLLVMSALEASQGRVVVGTFALLEATFEHEGRFWLRWLEGHGIGNQDDRARWVVAEAVAALTLRGGFANQDDARKVVKMLAQAEDLDAEVPPKRIIALLDTFYRGDGAHAQGLQPDVLGEHVVMRTLEHAAGGASAWLNIALVDASPAALESAFVVLGRLGTRLSEPAPTGTNRSTVEAWLKAVLTTDLSNRALPAFAAARTIGKETPLASVGDILATVLEIAPAEVTLPIARSILAELDTANEHPVSLRRLGVGCGLALAGALRADPTHDPASLASTLNSLGVRLNAVGQHQAALEAIEEAIEIRRGLARNDANAFLPDLAKSLNNLGKIMKALGRSEEAIEASRETARIYRKLTRTHPDSYRPSLALALNNLGVQLNHIGRSREAIKPTKEAVRIRRKLAEVQSDVFQSDLAMSLNNLAFVLKDLGLYGEALRPSEEAVLIRRRLAISRPDTFLPDLVLSLGARGSVLLRANRAREAVGAFAEALRLILPLARRLPAAFEGLTLDLANDLRQAVETAGEEPDDILLAEVGAIYGAASGSGSSAAGDGG